MRPVNLIPGDQRRGARGLGRAPGRSGVAVYGFLGVLGLVVLAVLALVLTSNRITDRKSNVAALERDAASAKAAADAVRPYGTFAQLQRTRVETVNSLVNTAFNWERVLRQVSRTIPSDAWLTTLTATVAPGVGLESGGGGGGSEFRSATPDPAVELSGCTYSHRAVARMMTRMRNLDDVSEVVLSSSERPTQQNQTGSGGAGADTGGGGAGGEGGTSGEDCRTKPHITKFEILVVLGEAELGQPSVPAGGSGSATPIASAQAAVTSSQQSAASAGAGQ